MTTMAGKMSKVKDGDEAARLAGNLLELADRIQARHALVMQLKERPGTMTVNMESNQLTMLKSWPRKLLESILATANLTLCTKDAASAPTALTMSKLKVVEVRENNSHFWCMDGSPAALSLQMLMTTDKMPVLFRRLWCNM